MFDGVFTSDPYGDRQRDEPQAAKAPLPWPLIAVSVVFAMLSIVAAVTYPEVVAAGLEQF